MDIADIVSTDFVKVAPEETVSHLSGIFEDAEVAGVVVSGESYQGVITRRQLTRSQYQPTEKVRSHVWQVPRLAPTEDVRKVARLMIEAESQLLPVFEGQNLIGVVTIDAILEKVQPYLDVATVGDAASTDLVTLDPDATFGDALHEFREHRIAHLPVVEDDHPRGILSLYDVTHLRIRAASKSQGGDPGGDHSVGGPITASSARAGRGGFGAREGDLARFLDLPVRDLMASPVRTIGPEETLDTAVERMFEAGCSSLIVTENDTVDGIVTKTDVLDTLTWEAGGSRGVQIYGTDLIDDMSDEAIVAMVEKFDDRNHGMNVLEAKIHLHKHEETRRGSPLLLARIRLHTDSGLFIASGEGYGARHAITEARDVLERQIREKKTYATSKKPRSEEFWEKRFGWLLEGED